MPPACQSGDRASRQQPNITRTIEDSREAEGLGAEPSPPTTQPSHRGPLFRHALPAPTHRQHPKARMTRHRPVWFSLHAAREEPELAVNVLKSGFR